jgi:hypothetical protein
MLYGKGVHYSGVDKAICIDFKISSTMIRLDANIDHIYSQNVLFGREN